MLVNKMDSQETISQLQRLNLLLLQNINSSKILNKAILNGLHNNSMLLLDFYAAR